MSTSSQLSQLFLTASSDGNILFDMGPISKLNNDEKYFHYIEALVKTEEEYKKTKYNFDENFEILISDEIPNIKSFIDSNGYTSINSILDTNSISNGILIKFNSATTSDSSTDIKLYFDIIKNGKELYYCKSSYAYDYYNTSNNEFNIFSIVINPLTPESMIYYNLNNLQSFQLLINHKIVEYDNSNNDYYIPNSLIFPYIENLHVYVLLYKQKTDDENQYSIEYYKRTSILFNTSFDRFIYKDLALNYYYEDKDSSKTLNNDNYYSNINDYNYYPLNNLNTDFPKRPNELKNNPDNLFDTNNYNLIKIDPNNYQNLFFSTTTINKETNIQMETISKAYNRYNDIFFKYIYIGTIKEKFYDIFNIENLFTNYNYTPYSVFSTIDILKLIAKLNNDDIVNNYIDLGNTIYDNGLLLLFINISGSFIIFILYITNNKLYIIKFINNSNITYYNKNYTNCSNILNFIDIDNNNHIINIITNYISKSISNDSTDIESGLGDANYYSSIKNSIEIPSELIDIFNNYLIGNDKIFIVTNSNDPSNFYFNTGQNKFYVLPPSGSTNIDIKKRNKTNNSWKRLIPFLNNKTYHFSYITKDAPLILPLNIFSDNESSIKLSIKLPKTNEYDTLNYYVLIGSGIYINGDYRTITDPNIELKDGLYIGVINDINGVIDSFYIDGNEDQSHWAGYTPNSDLCQTYGLQLCLYRNALNKNDKSLYIYYFNEEWKINVEDFTKIKTIAIVPYTPLNSMDDIGYVTFNANYTDDYEFHSQLGNKLLDNDKIGDIGLYAYIVTKSNTININNLDDIKNYTSTFIIKILSIKENGDNVGTTEILDLTNKKLIGNSSINISDISNDYIQYSINWDRSDSTYLAIDVVIKDYSGLNLSFNYGDSTIISLDKLIISDGVYNTNIINWSIEVFLQQIYMTIQNIEINPSVYKIRKGTSGYISLQNGTEFIITLDDNSSLFDSNNEFNGLILIGFYIGDISDGNMLQSFIVINTLNNSETEFNTNVKYSIEKLDNSKIKIIINKFNLIDYEVDFSEVTTIYLSSIIEMINYTEYVTIYQKENILEIDVTDQLNLINKNTINDSQFYTSYNGNGVI